MSTRKKLHWLTLLGKLEPSKQSSVIKNSNQFLVCDLVRVVKAVNKSKDLKLNKKQQILFKQHKGFLRKLIAAKGVKKLRKLLLSRTSGGGLILGAILPALISLVTSIIPNIFG